LTGRRIAAIAPAISKEGIMLFGLSSKQDKQEQRTTTKEILTILHRHIQSLLPDFEVYPWPSQYHIQPDALLRGLDRILMRLQRRCQDLEFAVDIEDLSPAEALDQLRQAVIAAVQEMVPDASIVEKPRIVPRPPRAAEFEHIKLNIHRLIADLHSVYQRMQQESGDEYMPANVVPLPAQAPRHQHEALPRGIERAA
jgi:hypothetical protein